MNEWTNERMNEYLDAWMFEWVNEWIPECQDKCLIEWMNEWNVDLLLQELRDIHTDLTEEDIATLATARLAEEQPRDRMWYRINAVKVLGGKSKLQPTVNARLATV